MPAKKTGPSRGMKIGIILLVVVLILSSVLVVFNYWAPKNVLTQPSPSSFAPQEWMQFIPAGVEGFRFINMSRLAGIEGLFQNNVLLNLTALGMNVTINDARYGLDMLTSSGVGLSVLAVNLTYAEAISWALANSSYQSYEYHNSTIYAMPMNASAEAEDSWICVNRNAIVVSEGSDLALAAVKSAVDANATAFFNNDTLKIAYLLTSNSMENFVFTYYTAGGNNTYNVDWLMGGASNSTKLDLRLSYHFQTPEDLNRNYQNFTSVVLTGADAVYTSGNFMIGTFSYAQSALRQLLMSM